ncbi:MAG: serine/threonine protein kinase, partial [Planctomycetes bacterium]|nr:serine/threonine protein kinase [Planctomycetota bacterium]
FRAEAAAAGKTKHPNVVRIDFIGEDAGTHFFAMELVRGKSLAQRLAGKRRFSVDEALAVVDQCLAGLEAAHAAGLIHRDIKPGNVLIEDGTNRVVLVDFGLVRRIDASTRITATGVIMGTVDYISPEQVRRRPDDVPACLLRAVPAWSCGPRSAGGRPIRGRPDDGQRPRGTIRTLPGGKGRRSRASRRSRGETRAKRRGDTEDRNCRCPAGMGESVASEDLGPTRLAGCHDAVAGPGGHPVPQARAGFRPRTPVHHTAGRRRGGPLRAPLYPSGRSARTSAPRTHRIVRSDPCKP